MNVNTSYQVADLLTKPFTSPAKWQHAIDLIGLVDYVSINLPNQSWHHQGARVTTIGLWWNFVAPKHQSWVKKTENMQRVVK